MSDRRHSRMTEDDALGRQIKANLRGLDAFVLAAPPFAEIQPSAPRPSETRGKSAVRLRQNLRATPGLLVAGMLVVVVLGSVVWRPGNSAGAGQSPTASDISSIESGTSVPSDNPPTAAASASPTTGVPGASLEGTAAPTSAPVPSPSAVASFGGGEATSASPWYADEVYILGLINCTRTGGWVSNEGGCGSDSHHTLPAQSPLVLDQEISTKVARPYARYLAERGILTHLADHDPSWRMCSWGGFCGGSFGENLASPGVTGARGMTAIEIFYQNESFFTGGHYANIMDPRFHRVGIGVWETSGIVRVAIEFYE